MGKTSKKQSNGAMPPKTSASTPAVKDGRATKPAAAKAKNEMVQKVAAANLREEGHKSKKTKKTKKAPSPESESDSDESDGSDSDVDMDSSSNSGSASSASSSGSESESEDEKVAPTKSANGVKAKASKNVEQDTSSSSESSEDSENEDSDNGKQSAEANKPKSNGNSKGVKKTTKPEDDSEDDTSGEDKVASTSAAAPGKVADPQGNSDSDSDSDGDSEDDSDADDAKLTVKANGTTADEKNTGGDEKDVSCNDFIIPASLLTLVTQDDGSDESASDDDDGSDESSDEEAPPASKKRKAENVASSEAKKARVETKDIPVDATNNLFVGQLSWNVDEEWLKREFEGFGTVTNAQVKTDRESGRSRGFGFVEFAEIADAVKAKQEMHGAEIDGRAIKTDYSPTRTPNPPKFNTRERAQQYGDRESSPSDTLFVGNLSFDADDSMVREVFEQYGTVTRVALPTDQATGNLKGYGYISYTTMDEAKEAKAQLTGGEIAGRSIRLDFAGPRPTNNGNSGGRGNFGGRGGRGRGGFGDRGGRGGRGGGRGGSTNRGGFSDFKGKKTSF